MFFKKPRMNRYGWRPDMPDHRDFAYAKHGAMVEKLPDVVDLRSKCSPVEDQGELGSCTAQALVGNLEFLEILSGVAFKDLSRLFVYYNERMLDHDVGQDNGSQLRTGIKALASYGVCEEINWPYIINRFSKKPTVQCYSNAITHKISQYVRLNTLHDMLHCLASGYPFVFGFTVYDYFESDEMATKGVLKMPTPEESVLGGHAICCVGYDQTKKMLLIRNSWGTGWGLAGYFWMPFDYAINRNLADDFWTIRK